MRILILFSTVDGHTHAICLRMQALFEAHGHEVVVMPVNAVSTLDCDAFDNIVIGASIRFGRHRPAVYRFITEHRACLDRHGAAFFSVSAVARRMGKDTPAKNPYFRALCERTGWQPALAATFAGRINYPAYAMWERVVIRFIMWLTHGPTEVTQSFEFTDWGKVDAFARRIVTVAGP